MKIFISQPMHGKTLDEILERRKEIIDLIYLAFPNESIDIIDQINYSEDSLSAVAKLGNSIRSAVAKLGNSIRLMSGADLIIADDLCEGAYGCYIETSICVLYKLPFLGMKDLEMLAELPNE